MKTTNLLLVVALIPALTAAADAPLFNFSMPTLPGKDGASGSMKFEEIDRTDKNSVVEVSGTTPGSDWSSTFLLYGMCGLAKARGQRYFQAKEIDSGPLTFEVTFPMTSPNSAVPFNGIAPNVFPVSQCPVLTYGPKK
jgi:hypothetical protein